jgi:hypothetical protein
VPLLGIEPWPSSMQPVIILTGLRDACVIVINLKSTLMRHNLNLRYTVGIFLSEIKLQHNRNNV